MNMFARKVEPAAPAIPNMQAVSPEVAAFIDSTARQREELTFYKSECSTLTNEVKLQSERIRMLESELSMVRDQLDYVSRHDTSMLTSLDNIETLIIAAKKKARAEAYAPPGSGADATAERTADAQEKIDQAAAELGKMLAPEPVNA